MTRHALMRRNELNSGSVDYASACWRWLREPVPASTARASSAGMIAGGGLTAATAPVLAEPRDARSV